MWGKIFKIISKYGVKCQFGSTPGVGCQDGTFTIKTLLHIRHNHNLPTWVAFVDLAKAFEVGVKQGYGMSPLIFLLLMISFAETL